MKTRKSNDQRSNAKNLNNRQYVVDLKNQIKQAYKKLSAMYYINCNEKNDFTNLEKQETMRIWEKPNWFILLHDTRHRKDYFVNIANVVSISIDKENSNIYGNGSSYGAFFRSSIEFMSNK